MVKSVSVNAFLDWNTARYWLVLALIYALLVACNPWSFAAQNWFARLAITLAAHVPVNCVIDFFNYVFGLAFYDSEVIIERGYSASALLNDTLHSVGLDYGFNFYNGDYQKTRRQAQKDKFEYAIAKLAIKRGARVMDVGCGCGDWIDYLKREYDCDVHGINITQQQVLECHARGLDQVVNLNWKLVDADPALRRRLYGTFDFVTFWDTVEHYVPSQYHPFRDKQDAVYRDMFQLARKLLKSKSKKGEEKGEVVVDGRIWISCLHMARRVFDSSSTWYSHFLDWKMLKKMWYCYILDRFHSGYYPSYYYDDRVSRRRDQLVENAQKEGLRCAWRKNCTYDYYITSVMEPTHFGRHKFELTPWRVFYLVSWLATDPHWLHRLGEFILFYFNFFFFF